MIKQLALATCIALCGVNVEAGEDTGNYTLIIHKVYTAGRTGSMGFISIDGFKLQQSCKREAKKALNAFGRERFQTIAHCVKKD